MKTRHHAGRALLAAACLAALFAAPALGQQRQAATWSKATPLPQPRNELQAATVDGKIYLIGGGSDVEQDGKDVEQYTEGFVTEFDPATGAWRERTHGPEGLTHQGIAVLNGKIYLAGGFAGGRHTKPSAGAYAYDPKTDKWQTLAPLPQPQAALAMVAIDGKIQAFGGRSMGEESTNATHLIYDPAANTWSEASPVPVAHDHVAIFVVDGKVHIIGGRTGESTTNIALHEVYDPKTDKWSMAAPMPTARSSVAFADYRGLLFVAGGECRMGKAYDEVEAYDPKKDSWLTYPALPTARHGFAAAVAAGKLYFFGGSQPCGGKGKVADSLVLTLQ